MADQQSSAEPNVSHESDHAEDLFDGKVDENPGDGDGGFANQDTFNGSLPNPPAPACKTGFRKLRILLWKNYLLRKRELSSLIVGLIVNCLMNYIIVFAQVNEGPLETIGTMRKATDPKEVTQDEMIGNFSSRFGGKELLFVAEDPDKAWKILTEINLKTQAGIKWTNVTSEKEAESEFNMMYAKRRSSDFEGAIIFKKLEENKVEYKIRLRPLPNTQSYNEAGLLGLQLLLDEQSFKALHVPPDEFRQTVTLKSFPYPAFRELDQGRIIKKIIILTTVFVLMLWSCNEFLIRQFGYEKEKGLKELLELRGYPKWMQMLSWYIISTLLMDFIAFALVPSIFFFVEVSGGKAFFKGTDFSLWVFILILATISNSAFIFLVHSVTKSTIPVLVFVGLWTLLVSLALAVLLVFVPNSFSLLIIVSILPHGCLTVALKGLIDFDNEDSGVTWGSLDKSFVNTPGMSFGIVIVMFLVDIGIYHSLAIYLSNIIPSEYGVCKPWYYPFRSIFARFRNSKPEVMNDQKTESKMETGAFEPYHDPSTRIGVDVENLVKIFDGNKPAVNGVTVKMYDGQIFALLGHNGAGKTTLIAMLAGMCNPTSGTVKVGGHDIVRDMDKARQSLGLCPQADLLYESLSVMDHLMIFGQMNGENYSRVAAEAMELLKMMKLDDKEATIAKELSGGQKRKLCLAMALIGGAKVVILDEPTSGMDPEARRSIWDFLLKIREQRTLLLTTHYMEEADALGDRIGIMAKGKLQCCGSPSFLKSYFGTGYTLKMSLHPGADKNAVLALVQNHVSDASFKPINMPNEIFISLPTETTSSSALSSLFSALTQKKEEMRIESLGLSVASMDEIFVKVGEFSEKGDVETTLADVFKASKSTLYQPNAPVDIEPPRDHPSIVPEDLAIPPTPTVKRKGFSLTLMQSFGILIKRYICTKRKIGLILFQLLFPSIVMLIVILSTNPLFVPSLPTPPSKITLDRHKNPVTLFSTDQSRIADVEQTIGKSAKYSSNVESDLRKAAKSDLKSFREKYIVAAEVNATEYTAWFNPVHDHAAPLAINMASNVRGAELRPPFSVHFTNHPLETQEKLAIHLALLLNDPSDPSSNDRGTLIMIILALVSVGFVIAPTEERLNQSTQLQLMTGIHPLIYWGITFLWDYFLWLIMTTAMIAVLGIFQDDEILSKYGGLFAIFIIIMAFGYAILPFAYVISKQPKTVAGGFSMFIIILYFPSLIATLMSLISSEAAAWVSRFSPIEWVSKSFSIVAYIVAKNGKCNPLGQEEMKVICSDFSTGSHMKKLKPCCGNCKTLSGVTCFTPLPYITWKTPSSNEPGIGQYLLSFLILSLLCQAELAMTELGGYRFIQSLMTNANESDFEDQVDDQDVLEEKQRVAEMIIQGSTNSDALVLDTLCKNYGSFVAVSKLTFGVHHGECFGLLGSNGAGKTTTFRILTGDELRSFGDAYEGPSTLTKNRRKFVSNIGYCPQSDGFNPNLTSKENLQLFARLRGVPYKKVNMEADKWLQRVGLMENGNEICNKYSGGMKRRLSAAMALIGDPALVLLDEPTSGVDPISRRQFWKVLETVKGSGQSIIITSHSMDECETICARLGIMVNGQLQCIGGVQHLKHKFVQGYSLTLRLKRQQQGNNEIDALTKDVYEKFHPCTLKDQHETVVQFQIENTTIGWDVLYKTLEDLKMSYDDLIEDYSVSETSLEEVFLSFSKKQYPARDLQMSLCKRILTCQC